MRQSDRVIYNVCQLYIASVCIGIGIVLTLPGDTFATSQSYAVLRGYPLSEDQWGMLWTALGVACALSTYFTRQVVARDGDDRLGGPALRAFYRGLRVVWFLITPIMVFWSWCFILANPATVGTVFFLATAALSQWVYWRVTREARRHG